MSSARKAAWPKSSCGISPFDRVTDYLTFLSLWQRTVADLEKDEASGKLPDVRFAVHLVRTRKSSCEAT